MDNNVEQEFNTSENDRSYRVELSNYNGPLDMLLDLVHRKKIRIEDIFISDIIDQYLAAMDQLDELDIEQAADFIVIASTLVEIKSRALLPRPPEEEDPHDDPKTELIVKLKEREAEYILFKEAAEKMREQEVINMHYRAPDESVGQPRLVLKDMTMDGLVNALRKMFDKLSMRQQVFKTRKVALDPFTVDQKMSLIRQKFMSADRVIFDDLFSDAPEKSEIVTTFMALLELLKLQEVRVEQKEIFDIITIVKRSKTDDGN
ncbi:MAG: segregation/condensation protein A [Roseburia sp.]|nr:segregation/condensation protein A [Roseburia sp.]